MGFAKDIVRLAAVADIHYTTESGGTLRTLFGTISREADVFLLCGDATDNGLPEEAQVLVEDLTDEVRIPIVAVLGNHDFESGRQDEVKRIFSGAGIHMTDDHPHEIHGVGFAGAKGFAGGFDARALQPWGEEAVKHFVREAVEEAFRLESALARVHSPHRVVLLHYSPIRATVGDEHPEILPFLGSSRLEEPINRAAVSAVFHGHAHGGNPEGATRTGIPVYNVSMPLLRRIRPGQPPFRLHELRTG